MTSVDPIAEVMAELQECLDDLPERLEQHRAFLATYRRTTAAVGAAAARDEFEERAWVEHWDAAFGRLYLTALHAEIARTSDHRVLGDWRSPHRQTCRRCGTSCSGSTLM